MRISVSGPITSQNIELIDAYVKTWSNYRLSDKTDKITQALIDAKTKDELYTVLNDCIDDALSYKKTDNIIHKCTVLDALTKIFILKAKDDNAVDDLFIQKAIHLAKQGLHFYDIIYFTPFLEKYSTMLLTDAEYVELKELNNFYLEIQETYTKGAPWIFDFNSIDGVPALIELFGNTSEMIQMIKLYQNTDGNSFGKDDSLIQEIINN